MIPLLFRRYGASLIQPPTGHPVEYYYLDQAVRRKKTIRPTKQIDASLDKIKKALKALDRRKTDTSSVRKHLFELEKLLSRDDSKPISVDKPTKDGLPSPSKVVIDAINRISRELRSSILIVLLADE